MNVVNKVRGVIADWGDHPRGNVRKNRAYARFLGRECRSDVLFAFSEMDNGSRGFPSEFTGDSYLIQPADKLARKDKDGDTPGTAPALSG